MPTEDDRPTWLLEYYQGVFEKRYYSVVLDGKSHAIVKRAGHMAWTNNLNPWHYERVIYEIVAKKEQCMRDPDRKELGEGRLTKAKLTQFKRILTLADKKRKK